MSPETPITQGQLLESRQNGSSLVDSCDTGVGVSREIPRRPVEAIIAAMWCELLGLESAGIHDHFLELGGDSLFATQVASRILDYFGSEVSIQSMFEDCPTIAELAAEVVADLQDRGTQQSDEA